MRILQTVGIIHRNFTITGKPAGINAKVEVECVLLICKLLLNTFKQFVLTTEPEMRRNCKQYQTQQLL